MMQKRLTHFELALSHVKHLTYDEKVALAKYLAMQDGIRMYTPADVEVIVQREIAKRQANSPILRIGN